MMDYGKKTLIFLTLCALAGAQNIQRITNNVEILVSVPSTHIGDTEIGPAVFTSSAGHPILYTVVAQKNETKCFNSTDPLCTSMIKEPKVNVLVSSRGSNGNSLTYSDSVNVSQQLLIHIGSEVTLTPQIVNDENDKITIFLDFLYDQAITVEFATTTTSTTTMDEEDKGQENGQSTLLGAQNIQRITNNLEILVSVPSTHIGDTEIGPAFFTASASHPFLYTVVAQKNETQCFNSTDPLCTSMIKEPKVNVSVSSRGSNGNSLTYSDCVNGSQQLVIRIGSEVTLTPQIMNDENDKITILLDFLYNQAITGYSSLRSRRQPTTFSLNVEFATTTTSTTTMDEKDKGQENGQSTLHSAPLSALILLALLPILLLK